MTTPLPAEFRDAVAKQFPGDFATDAPDDRSVYGVDSTRAYVSTATLVVRPRTTLEVSRFLKLCHDHRVAVVPSGGRTGLAGGAVANGGEVVLSLERMRAISPVDTVGATVRVEAGAITQAVHEHCAAAGLTWPVDFASKGSSQIGGNISTNAGGLKVIRYGHTRQWVLGLTVVTPQGTVLELNGALEKNNTGVDLRQLYIGSEGILGVITGAVLKLTRLPPVGMVMLLGVNGLEGVLRVFERARAAGLPLSAFEFFTQACLERVKKNRGVADPLETKTSHYVLMEVDADPTHDFDAWLEALLSERIVADGTVAQNEAQARSLWQYREGISESLAKTGLPHKNDISLPLAGLHAFSAAFEAHCRTHYPAFEICVFGHIGDGNLHVNVMKPEAMEVAAFRAECKTLDRDLFSLVREHAGSISAEHGIGLVKKAYLEYSRTPDEIELMRALKRTLDPNNILNPGKVFSV